MTIYFRIDRHYLDEGQFGFVPIDAPFNYVRGYGGGTEESLTYNLEQLAVRLNLLIAREEAIGVASGQYNFPPEELSYIDRHYIVLSFALTAAIVMRRRIAKALPHAFSAAASRHKLQQNPTSENVSHALSTSRSIKPKTWQRIHIAVAIGAMLPLCWHCDLGRASIADLLLRAAAILLLTSGFLGVAITDFTRWRLLSPNFSPRLSATLIRGLFIAHRGLALLTFVLITIHVLAVLYYAGI